MKLKTIFILVITTCLMQACKKEPLNADTTVPNKITQPAKLKTLNFRSGSITLFSFENEAQLLEQMNTTFTSFMEEVERIKNSNEEINHYLINLKCINHTVVVNKVIFLNTDDKKIIDVFEEKVDPTDIDWASLIWGSCKPGWTNRGTCSTENCIKEKMTQLLRETLTGSGTCVQTEISRGLLSVQICSKGCE